MGQYRPSNLIPSTLTQTYSIDATTSNTFSCQINGASPTISYRLQIFKNNTTSTSVYDTGVVTLASPLYPVTFNGEPSRLSIVVPTTSGMINGTQYKWVVTTNWSGGSLQSYENVFDAYATPSLVISAVPATITTKSYIFSAAYTQTEGVVVERFGWILQNSISKEELVNTIDNGNIYSADLRLEYDGFLTGASYEVKIRVWLTNGVSVETAYSQFSVVYDVVKVEGLVEVQQTCDGGALVSWPTINYILGTTLNINYRFTSARVEQLGSQTITIDAGNYVKFDNVNGVPMVLSSYSSHTVSFAAPGMAENVRIYQATGTNPAGGAFNITLFAQSGALYLDINGGITYLAAMTADDFWYNCIITPTKVYIYVFAGDLNGLYPSQTLYPGLALYPRTQTYSPDRTFVVNVSIPTDATYSLLRLDGKSEINYLWVVDGLLTSSEIAAVKGLKYSPTFSGNTFMLAKFEGTLNGGNASGSSQLQDWLIYRLEAGTSALTPVAVAGATKRFIVDYSIRNQSSVTYYVFPEFVTEIGSPLFSYEFKPSWWAWILMVCDYGNSQDTCYLDSAYMFDMDVSSGTLANNTSYSVLENFTRYSKIQNSNANYWTGTLSALIGNCATTYKDTVGQMNELKALSSDTRPKFLKDRKGNMWKVRINAPVQQQMNDPFIEQQVTVTLGWMEVGNSDDYSVVNNPAIRIEDVETGC